MGRQLVAVRGDAAAFIPFTSRVVFEFELGADEVHGVADPCLLELLLIRSSCSEVLQWLEEGLLSPLDERR